MIKLTPEMRQAMSQEIPLHLGRLDAAWEAAWALAPKSRPKRPERVQAAFEVWYKHTEIGPNASAVFEYILELEKLVWKM